jgi:hypothetical protein
MDLIVKKGEAFSYSDGDIKRLLDDDVRILKYPELANMTTLDEILGGNSCACILYMTKQNFGHWTALIKNPGGQSSTYEVFDPYGIFPDEELKYISEEFKDVSNQNRQHLSHIISDELASGKIKEVFYNKYKLQSSMQDINTCGRWCGIRCLLKRFSIQEFCLLFIDQKLTPDEWVTTMTLINK